jgi:hypothetical protein
MKKTLSMGMSKHALVLLLVLALVVPNFLPQQVKAFNADVHYKLKYDLLLKVGFTDEDAKTIANADVSVDFDKGTSNLKDWHACGTPAENQKRKDFLRDRAMNEPDRGLALKYFGQFLHFLEDMSSHVCPWYIPYWLWAIVDHCISYEPDYLSSYTIDQLKAMITDWLGEMGKFYKKAYPGETPKSVTWDDVKDGVIKVRDVNPNASRWTPPRTDPNWPAPPAPYNYDKDGNVIASVPPGKFDLGESEWLLTYNSFIYDTIGIIESSHFFMHHPEAGTAVTLLYRSIDELKYPDPPIDTLGYAISNLTGLSSEDQEVMHATTYLSLSMLYLVHMREYHVTYIALLKDIRYRADFNATLSEAYGEMENAGTEIEKIETDPYSVNFDYLTSSLTKAWEHLREAEKIALGGNNPPATPTIEGPHSGKAGTAYDYNFCSSDPDGDDIYYCVDWGDGSGEVCLGPFPSNTCITQSHTWTSDGTYTIKAKARDSNQAESEWATFSVSMPKNKANSKPLFLSFLQSFFEKYPNMFPILQKILQQPRI